VKAKERQGKATQGEARQREGNARRGKAKVYARATSGSKAKTERREGRKRKEKSGGQGGCRFSFSSRHIGDPSVDKIF
jgi:hypothetical protein